MTDFCLSDLGLQILVCGYGFTCLNRTPDFGDGMTIIWLPGLTLLLRAK